MNVEAGDQLVRPGFTRRPSWSIGEKPSAFQAFRQRDSGLLLAHVFFTVANVQ
jgi:hypothetical protein